jgi:hypothetical protein
MPDYAHLKRVPVQSRILKTVAYDESLHVMEVEYHTGSIYRYYDIPLEVYKAMFSEHSPGSFWNAYLKANRIRSKKVG